jgi:hypothetical protein
MRRRAARASRRRRRVAAGARFRRRGVREQGSSSASSPPRLRGRMRGLLDAAQRAASGFGHRRSTPQLPDDAALQAEAAGAACLRLALSPAPRYRSPDLLTRPGGPWTWPLPPRGAAPRAGGAPIARHHQHVQGVAGTPRCIRQRDRSSTCQCSAGPPALCSVPSASLACGARLIVISQGSVRRVARDGRHASAGKRNSARPCRALSSPSEAGSERSRYRLRTTSSIAVVGTKALPRQTGLQTEVQVDEWRARAKATVSRTRDRRPAAARALIWDLPGSDPLGIERESAVRVVGSCLGAATWPNNASVAQSRCRVDRSRPPARGLARCHRAFDTHRGPEFYAHRRDDKAREAHRAMLQGTLGILHSKAQCKMRVKAEELRVRVAIATQDAWTEGRRTIVPTRVSSQAQASPSDEEAPPQPLLDSACSCHTSGHLLCHIHSSVPVSMLPAHQGHLLAEQHARQAAA